MKEIILGLNAYHADSSAAIFVDGILIAATEEERFRRIKHWAGFPSEAIKFCLGEVGCTLQEVSAITIGRDPSAKKLNKAAFVLKHPLIAKSLWNQRSANKDDITLLHEQFRLVEPVLTWTWYAANCASSNTTAVIWAARFFPRRLKKRQSEHRRIGGFFHDHVSSWQGHAD